MTADVLGSGGRQKAIELIIQNIGFNCIFLSSVLVFPCLELQFPQRINLPSVARAGKKSSFLTEWVGDAEAYALGLSLLLTHILTSPPVFNPLLLLTRAH